MRKSIYQRTMKYKQCVRYTGGKFGLVSLLLALWVTVMFLFQTHVLTSITQKQVVASDEIDEIMFQAQVLTSITEKQVVEPDAHVLTSITEKQIDAPDAHVLTSLAQKRVDPPDEIIYSEDEVQVQLKTIHEEGERIINFTRGECRQRLPACLIIGNFKCGSQELIEFMFMHPRIRIYREPWYELHFFEGNYHKGLEWYRQQMPCSYENQITVEKTPSYFQDSLAPQRIHSMNSSIRLIVLVREPLARALSHFTFLTDAAKQYQNSFDRCVTSSIRGNINRNCFAVKHSIYDEGMDRYLKYFKVEQIMIIDSEEFKRDPFKTLYDIETFLKIEHVIKPEYFTFIKDKGFHCVRSVRNSSVAACYDRRRGRKEINVKTSDSVTNSTRQKLRDFFKPHNERFFETVGKKFDW